MSQLWWFGFAYRNVPKIDDINSRITLIAGFKSDIKLIKEQEAEEKKNRNRKEELERLEKSIKDKAFEIKRHEKLLNDMKSGSTSGHVILVFCLHCGQVVGTGAKAADP